jgi:hypothetical protein
MHAGDAASGEQAAATSPVDRALERARHILPDQGPIGVFVHHNTLHAFQHLTFHDAVPKGAGLLEARPYLPLDEFERHFRTGRISDDDLTRALARALGDGGARRLSAGISRASLWRALMLDAIDEDDATRPSLPTPCSWRRSCGWRARRAPRSPPCRRGDTAMPCAGWERVTWTTWCTRR